MVGQGKKTTEKVTIFLRNRLVGKPIKKPPHRWGRTCKGVAACVIDAAAVGLILGRLLNYAP